MSYRQFTASELKWIKSFERVMEKAPDTLFMFVGDSFTVFTKDENNARYMAASNGGVAVDGEALSVSIKTKIEYDGGDY